MKIYRILAAVHSDTVERISRILEGHDLWIVQTLSAAKAALDCDTFDLVFVGARFDVWRMSELLDLLREQAQHRKIPVVAAVESPSPLGAEAIKGLSHTSRLHGAGLFVNLNDFRDEPAENHRVRLMIEALAAPGEAVLKERR